MSSGAQLWVTTRLFQGAGQLIVQGSKMTSKVSRRVTTHFVPFSLSPSLPPMFFELVWPAALLFPHVLVVWAEDLHI